MRRERCVGLTRPIARETGRETQSICVGSSKRVVAGGGCTSREFTQLSLCQLLVQPPALGKSMAVQIRSFLLNEVRLTISYRSYGPNHNGIMIKTSSIEISSTDAEWSSKCNGNEHWSVTIAIHLIPFSFRRPALRNGQASDLLTCLFITDTRKHIISHNWWPSYGLTVTFGNGDFTPCRQL